MGLRNDSQFVFLDPHYAQTSSQVSTETNLKTYEIKKVKTIDQQKIAKSLSLSYLLHSKEDFDVFWSSMKNLQKVHPDNFYFILNENENDSIEISAGEF